MLLSLDTGSFRSNNHRLVPREHARLQERHNFLRFSRGNLLNIFYIFYLREETIPKNSEPENGEKVRLFVTDIETTFTQGEFSPERIISLDAADTNLDVLCVTANLSFEVVNLQLRRVFLVLGTKTLLLLPIICKEFTITLFSKGSWKKVVISFREPTSSPS